MRNTLSRHEFPRLSLFPPTRLTAVTPTDSASFFFFFCYTRRVITSAASELPCKKIYLGRLRIIGIFKPSFPIRDK